LAKETSSFVLSGSFLPWNYGLHPQITSENLQLLASRACPRTAIVPHASTCAVREKQRGLALCFIGARCPCQSTHSSAPRFPERTRRSGIVFRLLLLRQQMRQLRLAVSNNQRGSQRCRRQDPSDAPSVPYSAKVHIAFSQSLLLPIARWPTSQSRTCGPSEGHPPILDRNATTRLAAAIAA